MKIKFIDVYMILLSVTCILLPHISNIIHHIMLLLLICVGFIFKSVSILKRFPINTFFMSRFLFLIWSITSLIWAVYTNEVINRFLVYAYSLAIIFITFKLIKEVNDDEECIMIFFKASSISGLILSLYILWYAGYSLLSFNRLGNDAMSINTAATKFAYIALMQFILYLKEKKRIDIFALCYFCMMALLTGSKTAFLMILVAWCAYCYLKTENLKIKTRQSFFKRSFIIVCITLIIFAFITYFPPLYQIFGRRIDLLIQIIIGQAPQTSSYSTNMRIGLLQEAWSGFLKKPFTGWGEGSMIYFSKYHSHTHSSLLEILFSLGSIGVILYFFQYCIILSRFTTQKLKDNYSAIAMSITSASIVEITTSISHNDLLNWLMLLLAYMYILKNKYSCNQIYGASHATLHESI